MTTDERMPLETSFAVVRRGFDPRQVTERLDECDVEIKALTAARDAAVEQAALLSGRLDAERGEVGRLHRELRALSGLPDSVESMSERLQVMLRLAQDEFSEMRSAAQREVDGLCSLRERLAQDLDASRELIDKALPVTRSQAPVPQEQDGHRPDRTSGAASVGTASSVLPRVQGTPAGCAASTTPPRSS